MSRAKAALQFFVEYNERDQKRDERDGGHTFVANVDAATANDLLARSVETRIDGARATWKRYLGLVAEEIASKQSQLQAHMHQLQHGLYIQRDNIRERFEQELQELEASLGPGSARFQALTERQSQAQNDLTTVRARLKPPLRPLATQFQYVYLPFMLALSILEAPLNRASFELFFAESPALSLLLALAVGAILIYFAHIVGTVARSVATRPNKLSVAVNIGVVVFVFALSYAVMYGVAILRQGYINFVEDESSSGGLAEALSSGNVSDIATAVFSAALESAGVIFLVINLAVFAVGLLAAFFRHDPEPSYEPAVRRMETIRRRFENLKNRANAKRTKIMHEKTESLGHIANEIETIEADCEKIKVTLQNIDKETAIDQSIVVAALQRRLSAFRAGFARSAAAAGVAGIETGRISGERVEAMLEEREA